MGADPPCADQAAPAVAPRIDDHKVLTACPAQRSLASLAVGPSTVLVLDDRAVEDLGGADKIHAVLGDVLPPLAFVPFELHHLE
jgi:hypothetical protein